MFMLNYTVSGNRAHAFSYVLHKYNLPTGLIFLTFTVQLYLSDIKKTRSGKTLKNVTILANCQHCLVAYVV